MWNQSFKGLRHEGWQAMRGSRPSSGAYRRARRTCQATKEPAVTNPRFVDRALTWLPTATTSSHGLMRDRMTYLLPLGSALRDPTACVIAERHLHLVHDGRQLCQRAGVGL
jgi:hypothetical protein